MDSIKTDSGLTITDGTIVMLARFPGTKWIVRNGWYTYQGNQYTGWYVSSIPSQTTLPLTDDDLEMITIVSNNQCNCGHYPPPPCPPPFPPLGPAPSEKNPKFTESYKDEVDRAFITVNTLEDRDKLNTRIIPDGKIVRVNSVRGVIKYYSWNLETKTWEEETFGIKNEVKNVDERVSSIEKDLCWLNIDKEVIENG